MSKETKITVSKDLVLFKKRKIKYISVEVPEHLVDDVNGLIIKDGVDFQTESGAYQEWN